MIYPFRQSDGLFIRNPYRPRSKSDVAWDERTETKYHYDSLGRLDYKTSKDSYLNITDPSTGISSQGRTVESWTPQYKSGTTLIEQLDCFYQERFGTFSLREIFNYNTKFNCDYDARGNITRINQSNTAWAAASSVIPFQNNSHWISYEYNSADQIEKEQTNLLGVDNYREYGYNEQGQISFVKAGSTQASAVTKPFTYDRLGRLSNANGKSYAYNNYGNVTLINGSGLSWTRGNLLASYNGNGYEYNHQGVRFKKTSGGVTTTYYLDGSKILGENRSNGVKLRYTYDATGLLGVRYKPANSSAFTDYYYIKDALGNIVALTKDDRVDGKVVICRYYYTAFGECVVLNASGVTAPSGLHELAYENPFRWKSHYYDTATEWYYIDGRYYDPTICQYITVDTPENLLALAVVVYGLNRYGLTVNNAVALVAALYNIFTQSELYTDPTYERQLFWHEKIFKWLNEQGPLIRAILYLTAYVVVCAVAIFAPELLIPLLLVAAKAAITGLIIGGIMGGLSAAMSGGNIFKGIIEGAVYGALDGAAVAIIIFGIVTAIKAIANAVKAANLAKAQRAIEAANAAKAQQAAAQPRTFTSNDPYVADTANAIEARYPGSVKGTNTTLYRADGSRLTDIDIELANKIGIQVKSGKGTGMVTQLGDTASQGYKAIGYLPEAAINSGVAKGITRAGYDVFNNLDDLLSFLGLIL